MKTEKKTLIKIILLIVIALLSFIVSWFTAVTILDLAQNDSNATQELSLGHYINVVLVDDNAKLIVVIMTIMITTVAYLSFDNIRNNYHSELYAVTPNIRIPQRCGQGQHGTAWFVGYSEFSKVFPKVTIDSKNNTIKALLQAGYDDLPMHREASRTELIHKAERECFRVHKYPLADSGGGVVVGYKKKGHKEYINIVSDDKHTICIGSTGESKTRSLYIQSLCTLALAGESFFSTDVKKEVRLYIEPMLKRLGYRIIALDYRDMKKSMAFNFLQVIIDAVNENKINRAMQLASDLAVFLAGERSDQQDPMWHDGKIAVLAAGIIACVYDNKEHPENQNLPYVYAWLTKMCAEKKGGMLLIEYLETVGDNHPAAMKLAQANVAPSKTRGSFYTSAATSLSIFTDGELYNICNHSDFRFKEIVERPTAIFMHLPDNRKTFYNLATLFVSQLYSALTDYANLVCRTGRLPIRFNFYLEEFGNFAKIEDIQGKFSLARSLGIRFLLILQDYSQLTRIYGDDITETLKSNGGITVYLGTDSTKTNEEISKSCGNYTTSSYSESSTKDSGSNSMNLIQRPLLYPDEVRKISRPYELVLGKFGTRVSYAPDLTEYYFNTMLGLGDETHNANVRKTREDRLPVLYDVDKPPDYSNAMWVPENFYKFKLKYQKAGCYYENK